MTFIELHWLLEPFAREDYVYRAAFSTKFMMSVEGLSVEELKREVSRRLAEVRAAIWYEQN